MFEGNFPVGKGCLQLPAAVQCRQAADERCPGREKRPTFLPALGARFYRLHINSPDACRWRKGVIQTKHIAPAEDQSLRPGQTDPNFGLLSPGVHSKAAWR
jgi:hypothetical protein